MTSRRISHKESETHSEKKYGQKAYTENQEKTERHMDKQKDRQVQKQKNSQTEIEKGKK